MEEILHQAEVSSLSQCLQGFIHPRWCRISSINSITPLKANEDQPKIDGIIEDDSFPFKMVPFLGTFVHFGGGIVMAFSRVSEELFHYSDGLGPTHYPGN